MCVWMDKINGLCGGACMSDGVRAFARAPVSHTLSVCADCVHESAPASKSTMQIGKKTEHTASGMQSAWLCACVRACVCVWPSAMNIKFTLHARTLVRARTLPEHTPRAHTAPHAPHAHWNVSLRLHKPGAARYHKHTLTHWDTRWPRDFEYNIFIPSTTHTLWNVHTHTYMNMRSLAPKTYMIFESVWHKFRSMSNARREPAVQIIHVWMVCALARAARALIGRIKCKRIRSILVYWFG